MVWSNFVYARHYSGEAGAVFHVADPDHRGEAGEECPGFSGGETDARSRCVRVGRRYADHVRCCPDSDDKNAGPLPISIDTGLPQLFSTLKVEGTHVTLGAKPVHTTRDWARLHLLSVDPAFSGRLRVLIKNLQLGVDPNLRIRTPSRRHRNRLKRN